MKIGIAVAALALLTAPLAAQGKGHEEDRGNGRGRGEERGHGPKRYAVAPDRAVIITREVLVRQGFEVDRVETVGNDQVVWYRAGNRGRGRGKGPPVRMVIRRDPVANKVVFLETPSPILVDIDVRLRVP
jgi:hypothetical protein